MEDTGTHSTKVTPPESITPKANTTAKNPRLSPLALTIIILAVVFIVLPLLLFTLGSFWLQRELKARGVDPKEFGNFLNLAREKAQNAQGSDEERYARGFEEALEETIEKKSAGKTQVDINTSGNAKIPEGFPKSIPLYPMAKVVTTFSSLEKNNNNFTVMLTAEKVTPEQVVEYYQRELARNGWKINDEANSGQIITTFAAESKEGALTVAVTKDQKEQTVGIVLNFRAM